MSLSIFLWIVIKSRSIKTFHSQLSISIIIWIIGEIANTLQESGQLFVREIVSQCKWGKVDNTLAVLFPQTLQFLKHHFSLKISDF